MAVFFNSSSSMEENIDECQLGKDFQDATPLQYDHVLALLEASAAKNSKDEEPSKYTLFYIKNFMSLLFFFAYFIDNFHNLWNM